MLIIAHDMADGMADTSLKRNPAYNTSFYSVSCMYM